MTVQTKAQLRKELREARRAHVEAQPDAIRALLFSRPPAPVMEMIPPRSVIGLYRATPYEAPTAGYAKVFQETGHTLALPRFAGRSSPMEFACFTDPYEESDLEDGPFGLTQPRDDAETLRPDVLIMPLLGFTAKGDRLGQGGGHYDRYLAEHPEITTIGLAWDAQLCESLPAEPHDVDLNAIVTSTRIYGPF